MFAFTFAGKLSKSILLLNGVTGEAQKFEHDSFNFTDTTSTVVIKKELYVFKYSSPVSAYKIADFTSSKKNLAITTFPSFPHNEKLSFFAVSYWAAAGSIVLTGV